MNLIKPFTNPKVLISILSILIVGIPISVRTQTNDCYEVKYSDVFGLNEQQEIRWDDYELDRLLRTDFRKDGLTTSFLIPLIVHQIMDFHPKCGRAKDPERYQKLLKLYFRIRDRDLTTIQSKSISEQLDYIRSDFYEQALDDRLLARMIYTMDDGPLYGEIPKRVPNFKNGKHIQTDFGQLTIVKYAGQIYLIASDKEKRLIWARIMTGVVPNRYLADLEFDENPVQKTPLVTRIHLHTSERLTLYIKNDGRFMYYFHSW